MLDALSQEVVFSIADVTFGYYQIAKAKEDIEKTAFCWKVILYELFNRISFGLCITPVTFQRTMDNIITAERQKFVIPYLDDIIIYSKSK